MRKILCMMVMFILLLTACNNDEGSVMRESVVPADELITKSIKISEFIELAPSEPWCLQGAGSFMLLNDLNNVKEMVGLECLRVNGESKYSVHKIDFENGTEGYCSISYKGDADRVVDSWFVVKMPSKFRFNMIGEFGANRTTLEEIKQLDPATLVFGEVSPTSYHRFSDGTMMEIRYKNENGTIVMRDYGIDDDPANIVNHLFPTDLDLIK